jgi:hypothetical protein
MCRETMLSPQMPVLSLFGLFLKRFHCERKVMSGPPS